MIYRRVEIVDLVHFNKCVIRYSYCTDNSNMHMNTLGDINYLQLIKRIKDDKSFRHHHNA